MNSGATQIFKGLLSDGNPLGVNGNNKKNGVIPDMIVNADAIEESGAYESILGGQKTHLIDFKTHASTSHHNSESKVCGHEGQFRQGKVNAAYYKTAVDLLSCLLYTSPSPRD